MWFSNLNESCFLDQIHCDWIAEAMLALWVMCTVTCVHIVRTWLMCKCSHMILNPCMTVIYDNYRIWQSCVIDSLHDMHGISRGERTAWARNSPLSARVSVIHDCSGRKGTPPRKPTRLSVRRLTPLTRPSRDLRQDDIEWSYQHKHSRPPQQDQSLEPHRITRETPVPASGSRGVQSRSALRNLSLN